MHQLYMDKVDENLEEDSTVDTINAYGWFLLDSVHNAFTAGFMHEYSAAYDAHEAGLISKNEFKSAATKALGKSAAVLAVSALTGGVVGEFVSGAAAPFVGEGAASVIGGGVGGFSAGISGHFTGDVYDQLLNGKEGFDSAGDYMKSGAMGGAMGVTTAMISSLSIQSTGLLRSSALRTADLYAKRFPSMTSVFERIRAAGANRGVQLKLTVSELSDLIKNGMGGPGGPGALQLAGGVDFRMLPPETALRVRISADEMFNRPMEMSNTSESSGSGTNEPDGTPGTGKPGDKPALSIDSVETEPLKGTDADATPATSTQSPDATPATSTQAPDATPATPAPPQQETAYQFVEIADVDGSPIGEFDTVIHDGVATDRFVEDKSAKGMKNPKNRQTPEQWAKKQIFEKTSTRIQNLNKAASSRPRPDGAGSPSVPDVAQLRAIKEFEFVIESADADVKAAVEVEVNNLQAKYPGYRFSARFGN